MEVLSLSRGRPPDPPLNSWLAGAWRCWVRWPATEKSRTATMPKSGAMSKKRRLSFNPELTIHEFDFKSPTRCRLQNKIDFEAKVRARPLKMIRQRLSRLHSPLVGPGRGGAETRAFRGTSGGQDRFRAAEARHYGQEGG